MNGRRLAVLAAVLAALTATAAPAVAKHPDEQIVLPGATGAEGIAKGAGATFYAGDLFAGDIYRGNLQRGTAHVYDTRTGATVPTVQLTAPPALINDVAVTRQGAWFTDSAQAQLYFVPISAGGALGAPRTLQLSGPAADVSAEVNNNGIQATPNGKTLIVAHSGQGALNVVDPATGASRMIAGVSVPFVDGILLEGGELYAVQNFLNQIAVVRLSPHLTSGTVEELITSDLFQIPTTVARFGDRLATVNAKFDTGFPPTADQYEVIIVDR
jgi:hypothetical protein